MDRCSKGIGIFLFFLALSLSAVNPPLVWSAERLQTQRAEVLADSPSDLLVMEQKLKTPIPVVAVTSQTDGPFHPAHQRLKAKIDGLLQQVCRILNLRPSPSASLSLVLLKDGREVKKRQVLFTHQQPRPSLFGYGSLEAFYEVSSRTIYLSLDDLREGILAHEMAHFVFCNSLPVMPPEDEQEAWARYVESRL